MEIKIRKTELSDIPSLEKIHLSTYAQIGQKEGEIESAIKRDNMLNLTAVNETGEIVGYIISSFSGSGIFAEWIGVKYENIGIGKKLAQHYLDECKKQKLTSVSAVTRNRFKKAISGYMKNDFNIIGVYQGTDGDLMIQMRKEI